MQHLLTYPYKNAPVLVPFLTTESPDNLSEGYVTREGADMGVKFTIEVRAICFKIK